MATVEHRNRIGELIAELGIVEFLDATRLTCNYIASRCDGSDQGRLAAISWCEISEYIEKAKRHTICEQHIGSPFLWPIT